IKNGIAALVSRENGTGSLMTAVGLVVLALAVFDVGKYLMEEEVLRHRELKEPAEARENVTKFLTILIIALGLEALVYVFKVGRSDYGGESSLEQLIYPTMLIVAVAVLLVALGWYQRQSVSAEVTEKGELPLAKKGKLFPRQKDDPL
ncbi:MAG: hypothetical protein ACLGPL_06340, partial [Acidobacteriota bacterium]